MIWDFLREFVRSPLGKRLIGVLLATLGVSVTFNEVSESANRIDAMLDVANRHTEIVALKE